ncbi:hypothetical protein ECPA10_1275, partial [Escherichia coli PA10]
MPPTGTERLCPAAAVTSI